MTVSLPKWMERGKRPLWRRTSVRWRLCFPSLSCVLLSFRCDDGVYVWAGVREEWRPAGVWRPLLRSLPPAVHRPVSRSQRKVLLSGMQHRWVQPLKKISLIAYSHFFRAKKSFFPLNKFLKITSNVSKSCCKFFKSPRMLFGDVSWYLRALSIVVVML